MSHHHCLEDSKSAPSASGSRSATPPVLRRCQRSKNRNVFLLLAQREISPRTKHQAKKVWGRSSNHDINLATVSSYEAIDVKLALHSWAESQSLIRLSAQYCPLVPAPRSTIAAAFSSDGKTIASTHGDHTVKVIDCQTGNCLKILSGHRRTPWVVRFHPIHPDILVSGSLDHEVRLWDAHTSDCIVSRSFYRPIASLAFHAQGEFLAVATGHKLYIWNYNKSVDEASPVLVLKTRRSLRAVHFHPHGSPYLLTAEVNNIDSSESPLTEATSTGYLHYPPAVFIANSNINPDNATAGPISSSSSNSIRQLVARLSTFPCVFWPVVLRDDGQLRLFPGETASQHNMYHNGHSPDQRGASFPFGYSGFEEDQMDIMAEEIRVPGPDIPMLLRNAEGANYPYHFSLAAELPSWELPPFCASIAASVAASSTSYPFSFSFSLRRLPRSRSSPSLAQIGCLRLRASSPRYLATKSSGSSSVVTGEEASTSSFLQAPSSFNMAERTGSVKQQIAGLVRSSLQATFPDLLDVEPQVAVSAKFGDYQCNNAMGLWSKIKGSATEFKNPNSVGQALAKNLPQSEIIESTSVAGPGFVNIKLSTKWISERIKEMLVNGIQSWAPILSVERAVVDFSSPNIAKEMHVGHLRSTIIGDTLARMFEFSNVRVLRRNHVGDWGTQFGMLIEYLFEQFPNWEDVGNQAIGDLQEFYKASKKRFDDDASFKERAQRAVVKLQGGEAKYRAAWQKICEISRSEFDLVYERLNVQIEEKGESFYNPYIPDTIKELTDKGLVEESEGARVIFLEGFNIPLIVVKKDGGYNYASTDLTALKYRLKEEKAEWIIYVTDVGQQQHFEMFFSAARKAEWLPANEKEFPRVSHVGFGLVLGSDGKRFRTRSSEVVRLVELLDEAKTRSKAELIQRLENNGTIGDWTDEELEKTAEAVGYGAVKYADLKNNRLTNYVFSFDQMLKNQGNTAVYLEYAHARICSIVRKSNRDISTLQETGTITLEHPDERVLALHLIQFAEVVEEACNNLLPNVLCEYLYNLSEIFNSFYTNCKVIGSPEETSRLLLCQATALVMRQCFVLLGITPVFKL